MKAQVGDHIVVHSHSTGRPDRDGEVLEVHGADGEPPFLVKWAEDGHVGLVFPGPDAVVEHKPSG